MKRLKSVIMDFLPSTKKSAFVSIGFSFCLAILFSLICYLTFENSVQPYSDIVVGNISLPGVTKNVDFYAYHTFIFCMIAFFFIFSKINNKKFTNKDERYSEISIYSIIIALIPSLLVIMFKLGTLSIFNVCFGSSMVGLIVYLKLNKIEFETMLKLGLSYFYLYLSLSSIFALCVYFAPGLSDRLDVYFIPLFWIAALIMGLVISKLVKLNEGKRNVIIDNMVVGFQSVIPFVLLSLVNTRYYYQNSMVQLIYYDKLKVLVWFLIVLMIGINVYYVYKRTKSSGDIKITSLPTLVSLVAASFWNSSVTLIIEPDPFHSGETEIVWSQLALHGQKWGDGFVSVLQGLGYSVSALNEFLFGGTFATYVPTQYLGLTIAAILVVIALYFVVDKKWLLLFYGPVMPILIMNRTYFIALTLIFLLNPRLIKNAYRWTYGYIFTCIVHIWFQPTYGGAVSVSLLPVLAYVWYNAYQESDFMDLKVRKNIYRMSFFLVSVAVIGILCIPMLLNAIHFLRANSSGTMIGNGIAISQIIKAAAIQLTGYKGIDFLVQNFIKFGSGLLSCAIMLYMFSVYVIKEKDKVRVIQGLILTVSGMISYILILPASLTRIDEGLSRIGWINLIYFGGLTLLLFYLYWDRLKNKSLALLLCGVMFSTSFYIYYPPYLMMHKKVSSKEYIPNEIQYVTPEMTGVEKLGNAFVGNNAYLNEVMVLDEVIKLLLNENQTFFDFTDKSLYYYYVNKPVPGKYASSMIATNEMIQNEVIESLKQWDIPLVFINKPLRYIGVSDSLRSYRIYRHFMMADYEFVRYKGVDFLIRSDVDLTPLSGHIELQSAVGNVGLYDNYIDKAIYNELLLESLKVNQDTYFNSVHNTDGHLIIDGTDPFVVLKSDTNVGFEKVQLIEIIFKNKPSKGSKGQLFIGTDNSGHNETNTIRFDVNSDRVLVPVYKYEELKLTGKTLNLRYDFDDVTNGQNVTLDSINLYSLSGDQIVKLEDQYNEIASKLTDNRLNELYHQPYTAYLPREWGESFDKLETRFTTSVQFQNAYISDEKIEMNKKIEVSSTPVSVKFMIDQPLKGIDSEFVKMKLAYSDEKDRHTVFLVSGYDKNGNDFSEEFAFVTSSSDFLVPIGSSPNCLQAQKIESISISFSTDEAPYTVSVDEMEIYKLTK